MSWITPVFDRTQTNVHYGDPKGSLTVEALNRIEGNVAFLAELFDQHHLPREPIDRQAQQWIRSNYIYLENFNAIKDNIMGLKKAHVHWADTPTLGQSTFGDGVTYGELNDMEKILYDIYVAFQGLGQRTRVLGTFRAGAPALQYIRSTR